MKINNQIYKTIDSTGSLKTISIQELPLNDSTRVTLVNNNVDTLDKLVECNFKELKKIATPDELDDIMKFAEVLGNNIYCADGVYKVKERVMKNIA